VEQVQAGAVPALTRALRAVMGEEQWARFKALNPPRDTVYALTNGITDMYGMGSLPEAPGSAGPSASIGEQSKPTSNGATGSTSLEPATELTPTG
jgi:hypothetical protein